MSTLILLAIHISQSLHTKGHAGSDKRYSNFIRIFLPNVPIWIKLTCNGCLTSQLNKTFPHQKQLAEKQDFKGQNQYFNHRISFDTKGPIYQHPKKKIRI